MMQRACLIVIVLISVALLIDQNAPVDAQLLYTTKKEVADFYDVLDDFAEEHDLESCVIGALYEMGEDTRNFVKFKLEQKRGRIPSGFILVDSGMPNALKAGLDPNYVVKIGTGMDTIGLMIQLQKSLHLQGKMKKQLFEDTNWPFLNPSIFGRCPHDRPDGKTYMNFISARPFLGGSSLSYLAQLFNANQFSHKRFFEAVSLIGTSLGTLHFRSSNFNPDLTHPFNSHLFESSEEFPRGVELYHVFPILSPGFVERTSQIWTEEMVARVIERTLNPLKDSPPNIPSIDFHAVREAFRDTLEKALVETSYQPYVTIIHGLPDMTNALYTLSGHLFFRDPWRLGLYMENSQGFLSYFGSPEIDYFVALESLEYEATLQNLGEDVDEAISIFKKSYCESFHKKIQFFPDALIDSLGPDTIEDHDSIRLRLQEMDEAHAQCQFFNSAWSEYCHWIARFTLFSENPQMAEWLFFDFVL